MKMSEILFVTLCSSVNSVGTLTLFAQFCRGILPMSWSEESEVTYLFLLFGSYVLHAVPIVEDPLGE